LQTRWLALVTFCHFIPDALSFTQALQKQHNSHHNATRITQTILLDQHVLRSEEIGKLHIHAADFVTTISNVTVFAVTVYRLL
jgi:hypothetical protein